MLLLALAVAAAGLMHVVGDGHAAVAGSHGYATSAASQAAGDEPCCPDHDGEPHDTICGIASGCSFCVPVLSSSVDLRPNAGPVEIEPDAGRSGRAPPPHSRPPKLFANV